MLIPTSEVKQQVVQSVRGCVCYFDTIQNNIVFKFIIFKFNESEYISKK